jgi:hypothetical protein
MTDEELKSFITTQKKIVAEMQSQIAKAEKELKNRRKAERRINDEYRK